MQQVDLKSAENFKNVLSNSFFIKFFTSLLNSANADFK